MRTETTRAPIVLYVVAGFALPAVAQVDQRRAQEFLKEVQTLCERDAGRLWGVSLCGPMVIADIRTQTFATSQPAPEGVRPRHPRLRSDNRSMCSRSRLIARSFASTSACGDNCVTLKS
jgi:hypothetical protein